MNNELSWRLDASRTLWQADAIGLYDGYSSLVYEVYWWDGPRNSSLWICRLLWVTGPRPSDTWLGPVANPLAGQQLCQRDYEMRISCPSTLTNPSVADASPATTHSTTTTESNSMDDATARATSLALPSSG